VALLVLYVGVSNDSSFRDVDSDLTVAGLRRVNLDFEDGHHISRSRFADDVVHIIHRLRTGVCHEINIDMKYRWH